MPFTPPPPDCSLCPRLLAFRQANQEKFPEKHNAPVEAFGDLSAQILIVGLAPGLKGANFTGRPFTGDYAGDLLYATLSKFGLAQGQYGKTPNDGLTLHNIRITNAVRCVPPENKPTTEETKTCLDFLKAEIAAMTSLKAIISLGLVSHNAVLRVLNQKISAHKFSHGRQHEIGDLRLFDSYHCSRYNTQTRRLDAPMFESVFAAVNDYIST